MKKKIVIISSILLLISIGIYHIYETLAIDASSSNEEVFNFNISNSVLQLLYQLVVISQLFLK